MIGVVCSMAVVALTGCGGGSSESSATPTPFSQSAFNKGFDQYLAAEKTHFQDILGEKQGQDGLTPIFASKIEMPGVKSCLVHNTANDSAMVICTYGSYEKLGDAQAAYKIVKAHAYAALPNSGAKVLEDKPSADIPMRYVMQVNGAQAMVAIGKNSDTKKYDVGYVFAKPQ